VFPVSVAILAGGKGNRFQQSKALANVAGKPLILHMVDACEAYADEILLIVHNQEDRASLAENYPEDQIFVDIMQEPRCPLVGALTAFKSTRCAYTQILPCDSPLIHPMFFEIMWSMVEEHHAAVPRWPNGWIEPLHSVFLTDAAAKVARQCLVDGQHQMRCLISRIGRVIYLSTQALKSFDEKLHTFVNINTPSDLRQLERLLLHQRQKH